MIFLCVIALPLGFRLLWLWCIFLLSVKQENIFKEIFKTNADKDTMVSTGGWKKTLADKTVYLTVRLSCNKRKRK
jgi:hypothetical protein